MRGRRVPSMAWLGLCAVLGAAIWLGACRTPADPRTQSFARLPDWRGIWQPNIGRVGGDQRPEVGGGFENFVGISHESLLQ